VRLIDRYIGGYVLRGTLLTLMVLLVLFVFATFVDDLGDVGRGDYTLWRAIEYEILIMPRLIFSLFPVAALIGSLMGLGMLARNSELTVLRAAGVSPMQITGSVMKTGILLVVVALVVGEALAPEAEQIAHEQRSMAIDQHLSLRTGEGFWIRDGRQFINIRKVLTEELMEDIYIYRFDAQNRLQASLYARHAIYRQGQWLLEEIHKTTMSDAGVQQQTVDQAVWESPFTPDLVEFAMVKPERLSALGLYRYLSYLKENNLNTAYYEHAFWQKLIYPVATGVMIFLAIPMVLGRLGSVGIGQRIVVGVIVGVVFHILQQVAGHAGVVYGMSPMLSATLPTLLFFILGAWLLRRVR
jgi:lipopolysaccharide export system permease protein